MVRVAILDEFNAVARLQHKTLAPITDDLTLLNSGFDSMCFAILVTRLEDRLGIDPVKIFEEVDFPQTVGDFISIYKAAMESN